MDILKIRNWYRTPMGHMVRRTVQSYLNDFWPELAGKTILVIGYGIPYVHLWMKEAQVFCVMPSKMGGLQWPDGKPNRCCIAWENELPFTDEQFDLILIAHGLEFADNEFKMVAEAARVLKSDGHILSITPNRNGAWSRREVSPFSRGKPFSQTQLTRVLRKNALLTIRSEYALFTPPSEHSWIQKHSPTFEKFGSKCWAPLGGVIITEAKKDLYSGTVVRVESKRDLRLITARLKPMGS